MYIPNPYFKNMPKFGNLQLDYIFVENGYPILFTCKNGDLLYLCLCVDNYKVQKWVISPTNTEIITDLLKDNISVYSALKENDSYGCIATWKYGSTKESYEIIKCRCFDDNILPSKDFLLEDDGDSNDYLEILKNRRVAKIMDSSVIYQRNDNNIFITSDVTSNLKMEYDIHVSTQFAKYNNVNNPCDTTKSGKFNFIGSSKFNMDGVTKKEFIDAFDGINGAA